MQAIQDIFQIWPSVTVMAEELEQIPDTVRRWRIKQRIPPHIWPALIEKAARREKLITAAELMKLNTGRRPGRPRKVSQ